MYRAERPVYLDASSELPVYMMELLNLMLPSRPLNPLSVHVRTCLHALPPCRRWSFHGFQAVFQTHPGLNGSSQEEKQRHFERLCHDHPLASGHRVFKWTGRGRYCVLILMSSLSISHIGPPARLCHITLTYPD